jgi:hypothetical protein
MRPTIPENKVLNPEKFPESKTPTEELEFESEEVTAVEPFVEQSTKFILGDEDVEIVSQVAASQEISYDAALHIVLRDALDLYRWNYKRPVR